MAEKIALELDVQTGKSVTNLGNLEKATKKLNKTLDSSDKETKTLQQQFDALNKEIEEAPVNIRAMNKQIQQYQAIALEAGRTSPLGKEAIQKAAALKDRYIDIQNEVNRLANDGVKLQAALDIGTTVVAGFTAFQGVMAMSGVESEELRETMVKLQAAQSVLMGVETLRKNLEKESTIILVAKNAAEKANLMLIKATTVAQRLLGLSTDATTKSFKLMKGALIATGIGALVVGIGALIANFDKLKNLITGTTAAQAEMNEATKKAVDSISKELSATDKLQKVLNDESKTREEKVKAVKELQEEYPELLSNVDAEKDGIEAVSEALQENIDLLIIKAKQEALADLRAEKFAEIVKEQIDAQTGQNIGAEEYITSIGLIASGLGAYVDVEKQAAANTKQFTDELMEQVAAIDETDEALKREAEAIKAQSKFSQVNSEDRKNNAKIAQEAIKSINKAQDDFNKKLQEAIKISQKDAEARFQLRLARKEASAKELEDLIEIEKMKRNHLLKNDELTKNERRLIRFESEQEILKLTKEFNLKEQQEQDKQFKLLQEATNTEQEQEIANLVEQYDEKFLLAKDNAELELALQTKLQSDITAINDKFRKEEEAKKKEVEDKDKEKKQKELERQIALEDAKLSLASQGVDALINLTTAFAKDNEKSQKKAFEINKRLQIAQAIIQTYQGANAIFAAAAANPKTVLFPAQPFIAAGLAVANGLANVATISKQQFQSSSAGGGGNQAPDFSGGAGAAPQLSPVTNTSTLVPQEPTQVFVTETDITNTQNQVAVIQGQATLS